MRDRTLAALLLGCSLVCISPPAAPAAVSSLVVVVDAETGNSQVVRRATGRTLLTPVAFPPDAAQPILLSIGDGTAELLDERGLLRRWREPISEPSVTASPDAQRLLWRTAGVSDEGPLAGVPRPLRVPGWAETTHHAARWTPDSKALALSAATTDTEQELRIIEVPSGAERARTAIPFEPSAGFDTLRGVAPDGRFVVERMEPEPAAIALVDPQRPKATTWLPLPGLTRTPLVWSTDGTRGAVSTNDDGSVYVTGLTPTGTLMPWRQVAAPGPHQTEPVEWAHGTSRLLVATVPPFRRSRYHVIDTDTQRRFPTFIPRALSRGWRTAPMWSTDGRRLTYALQSPPNLEMPRRSIRRECPLESWKDNGTWAYSNAVATAPRSVGCDTASRVIRAYVRGTARPLGWRCHSVITFNAQVLCRRGVRTVGFQVNGG